MKKTKIIATIGPASAEPAVLLKMMQGGMDVARLNFSHGTHAQHAQLIRNIRAAAKKAGKVVGIVADLQGPKMRLGSIKETEVQLERGDRIYFVYQPTKVIKVGTGKVKTLPLQINLLPSLTVGQIVLLADGNVVCKVVHREAKRVAVEVTDGGTIHAHSGVNVPTSGLHVPSLSSKDRDDLRFALRQDVDFVALSFVRAAKDVVQLRALMQRLTGLKNEQLPWIISKIEKPQAVQQFDEILEVSDAIMVARGDLGIEMPLEDVPVIQKKIAAKCLRAGKPCIVATQMLESMVDHPRPTRAEVSDVANAVIDHADAVMLSEETAIGRYPVEAVQTMARVAAEAERSPYDDLHGIFAEDYKTSLTAFLTRSSSELARNLRAKAIVCATASGFTARLLARFRLQHSQIMVLTNDRKTYQRLSLVWGVRQFYIPVVKNLDKLTVLAMDILKKQGAVKSGDLAVLMIGYKAMPGYRSAHGEYLNFVAVHRVG